MQFDLETEVLVIGAGGCGLAAAVAAHDEGAQAMVVEKLDRAGGNTALSTGSLPGAGSKYQRERGIEDSPERMVGDLMRLTGPHEAPQLVELLARESAPLVDWLVERVGARMRLIHEYRHVGHSVPRLHAPDSRRGKDLFDDLMRAVESRGVPVALGNPVSELLTDSRGELLGARVQGSNVKPYDVRAHKIVLATNGYAANRALVERFCPEIAGAEYFGARGSEGEAILWGEKLGAAFANIGAYQGYAAIAYPHGSLLSWTTIEKGGILIDEAGRRFGNEGLGYSGYAREVLAQKQKVHAVFDQRICDIAMHESEFREQFELGGFKRDFGIGVLNETLNSYNRAARGGARDSFGRADFGIAPLIPPLYGCQVVPGLFHTQGGLRVDRQARVLRRDGGAIPHLFAGGGAAAGISGREGARGYASGNGLLTAIGLGRIAGKTAAEELKQ